MLFDVQPCDLAYSMSHVGDLIPSTLSLLPSTVGKTVSRRQILLGGQRRDHSCSEEWVVGIQDLQSSTPHAVRSLSIHADRGFPIACCAQNVQLGPVQGYVALLDNGSRSLCLFSPYPALEFLLD